MTKTQAKKLALLKAWYNSQPDPSKTTWCNGKEDFDTFIMQYSNTPSQVPTTPSPSQPTNLDYTAFAQITPLSQDSH